MTKDKESSLEEKVEKEPRIDPDVGPYEPHNVEAAKKLGLKYDRRRRVYRDKDGCPTRDRFGQRLG